jgi:hypothetical protein
METDFLPTYGTDYIEFYVGNAKQAAHYSYTPLPFACISTKIILFIGSSAPKMALAADWKIIWYLDC